MARSDCRHILGLDDRRSRKFIVKSIDGDTPSPLKRILALVLILIFSIEVILVSCTRKSCSSGTICSHDDEDRSQITARHNYLHTLSEENDDFDQMQDFDDQREDDDQDEGEGGQRQALGLGGCGDGRR